MKNKRKKGQWVAVRYEGLKSVPGIMEVVELPPQIIEKGGRVQSIFGVNLFITKKPVGKFRPGG
jgi:dihydroxyacid dehydratase/phosphogluconate dehydratase